MRVFRRMTVAAPVVLGSLMAAGVACRQEKQHQPEAAPVRLVEIIAGDRGFNPDRVFAEPGQELIIALRNEGMVPQTIAFALPDTLRVLEERVEPQEREQMRLRAPTAPGSYPFYGPLGDPRKRGMVGTLIVREPPRVALQEVASGLTSPVSLAVAPDGSGRRFIVDQVGRIRILTAAGKLLDQPFLDVHDRIVALDPEYDERGLLGLAFHPRYAQNGRFFVYYSAPLRPEAPDYWNHTSHISEFRVSADNPNVADPGSEQVLLAVDQPQSNHNAGTLVFGPDGYLYISLGDGGGDGDDDIGHTPLIGNGQDPTNLLGSILRIDVDSVPDTPRRYAIPPDNPFVDGPGRAEIFAYGLRNPYRISFDRETGVLLAEDAGQDAWEEVSVIERGGNYGWHRLEGTHCFDPETPENAPAVCAQVGPAGQPLRWPVIEIPNAELEGGLGQVIVGGYMYRGRAIPALAGRYVFGVWSAGHEEKEEQGEHAQEGKGEILVASLAEEADDLWPIERVAAANRPQGHLGRFLLGFGQDADGELYVLTTKHHGPYGNTGKVFALVAP